MKTTEQLENELEEEKDHSAFLEKLLRVLYGDGWDKLTISDAKQRRVIKVTKQTDTPDAANKSFQPNHIVCNQCENEMRLIAYCVVCDKSQVVG
jgi:hypothetical protein